MPVHSGQPVPIVIRDLALVRKLCGRAVRSDLAVGSIRIFVPGEFNGGNDLVVSWAIDPGAWDQQGKGEPRKPGKEAA